MIPALPILTLALLGQADAFTLHFEGFVSTREMNQEQLNKMFRAAFEQVSDEPESLFAVSDSPNADVLASASQYFDHEGLVFHWSLSTTKCPIRTLDFDQQRPRKALTMDDAKVMVREVAKKGHQLLHGHLGSAGLACLEEGQSMGGTATASAEPVGGDEAGGYGYASYGYGYPTFTRHSAFFTNNPTSGGGSTGGTGGVSGAKPGTTGTSPFPGATSPGVTSRVMPGPAAVPNVPHAAPAPTGTLTGPKATGATLGTGSISRPGGSGVGATKGGHH